MMDLTELGGYLFQDMRDLLRIETLDWYDSAADDPHYRRWLNTGQVEMNDTWQAWLDRIRGDTEAGITWRRVHVVSEPLTDYLRFELGVQYVANAQAGEQIRIFNAPTEAVAEMEDFFVANGHRVAVSSYDTTGKFQSARVPEGADQWGADQWAHFGESLWAAAVPFAEWWADRPQYHNHRQAA